MEHSATFTPREAGPMVGQIVHQGDALWFKLSSHSAYSEALLKTGSVMLLGPDSGPPGPDLLALRDECQKRGIDVSIGRFKMS
jgi:hypothetical protein